MESKKGVQQQSTPENDPHFKHSHLHHNNNPQQLRLLQYGLKIPNHHQHPVAARDTFRG